MPWGRYCYLVNPQGQGISRDAYNMRYDKIMENLERWVRCINNCALWYQEFSDHFHHVVEFLALTSSHGITQNPTKFLFGKKEEEFIGFQIREDDFIPCTATVEAIRQFPRPQNITRVRALFGLVEQVLLEFSKTNEMEPFRDLLKKEGDFTWSAEFQTAFKHVRQSITDKVVAGVNTFVLGRPTEVVTDWSKSGVGFVLLQKSCPCKVNFFLGPSRGILLWKGSSWVSCGRRRR